MDIVQGVRPTRHGFRVFALVVDGWSRVETDPAVVEHNDGEFGKPPRGQETERIVAIAGRKGRDPDDQGVGRA